MTTEKTPYEACAEIAEAAGRDLMARGKLQANVIAQHIADAIRAAATPAWEPLTPEVLARLLKEPPAHPQRIYWLAGKNTKTPVMGTIVRSVFEVVFNTGPRLQYASEFTHIMRFITPDLPA